jgi:hypothetical protein
VSELYNKDIMGSVKKREIATNSEDVMKGTLFVVQEGVKGRGGERKEEEQKDLQRAWDASTHSADSDVQ